MGLFSFSRKSSVTPPLPGGPYKDSSVNLIYHLLFCDNPDLYKANTKPPLTYPYDVVFSEKSSIPDLQKVITDDRTDPRVKILAYNRLLTAGHKPEKKELLAVIVEVGLENGLDVLASFNNGTARYINQTGKILIWETTDPTSTGLTKDLFAKSQQIVHQISPWDKPRRPCPAKGYVRISFLVSDGLYLGEGPMNTLFSDPLAGPALGAATQLMKYLTESL